MEHLAAPTRLIRFVPRPNCTHRSRLSLAPRRILPQRLRAHSCCAKSMHSENDYKQWTHDALVDRVTALEAQLRNQNGSINALAGPTVTVPSTSDVAPQDTPRAARKFDPSRFHTRKIALKLAYLGQRYNGFEWHANNVTPLPTIEEELWRALYKTRLIFPVRSRAEETHEEEELGVDDISWEGCDYSKCGRTDKGVSAFGQVVVLRLRSARLKKRVVRRGQQESEDSGQEHINGEGQSEEQEFDGIRDELPYARMLNRVLPEDIRILAWCPAPSDDFSARFSCRERRYRYFFTQPAYYPIPGFEGRTKRDNGTTYQDGTLDIAAMQAAAQRFVGLHDFRNFCKVDPSKQIVNFERRIRYAAIEQYTPFDVTGSFAQCSNPAHSVQFPTCDPPQVFCFTVHGTAFLWHQIRHMIGILFLIGQGLEQPSVVDEMLDIAKTPQKPNYEMATDAPLVLWDCIFPSDRDKQTEDALDWIYTDSDEEVENYRRTTSGRIAGRFGPGSITDVLWSGWRSKKIDELLAGSLLELVLRGHKSINGELENMALATNPALGIADFAHKSSPRIFHGGHGPRLKGRYVPIMRLSRAESPDVVNAKYLAKKPASSKPPVSRLGSS